MQCPATDIDVRRKEEIDEHIECSVNYWICDDSYRLYGKMEDLEETTWIQLNRVKDIRKVASEKGKMRLTDNRAVDFPIVKGIQIPMPMAVSRTNIIRAACHRGSARASTSLGGAHILNNTIYRTPHTDG